MTTQIKPRATATRARRRARGVLGSYRPLPGAFDELFSPDGSSRQGFDRLIAQLDELGPDQFKVRQRLADVTFRKGGITFSVYSDNRGVEKIFPFDLIPRPIISSEWRRLEAGLEQRVRVLNLFLQDVYSDQRILKDKVVPGELVLKSRGYLEEMHGIRPRGGTYVHVAGVDLIRRPDGTFVVLEDNIRTPSGVSYVLENRQVLKKVHPGIFQQSSISPVDQYPMRLKEALLSVARGGPESARLVVLTPGPYNSAYFEHSFLARLMGTELVQGQDLFVWQEKVFVKTTRGPQRVDVIYRRVDDAFLDPQVFRSDSLLGVPGLVKAYARGNVTLANAIGNGVGDDKAIYPYVPDMVRYYLKEEPIIGQVETYICSRKADLDHVIKNMAKLVTKSVDESGGYGMVIGPNATRHQIEEQAALIRSNPRGYIAQPRIELSTCPTWVGSRTEPRRVDLRPYVVTGQEPWVLPGGLTRVALTEGSYVVNSSQGGGSKDTWVLDGDHTGGGQG